MNMEEYDYDLPEELIAQTPLKQRDASRLLVLDPRTEQVKHDTFYHFTVYFKLGDCLVINDSRVIPVRLFGSKQDKSAKIELLLLHEEEEDVWEALVKPAKKVKPGTEIIFGDGQLKAICMEERAEVGRA